MLKMTVLERVCNVIVSVVRPVMAKAGVLIYVRRAVHPHLIVPFRHRPRMEVIAMLERMECALG